MSAHEPTPTALEAAARIMAAFCEPDNPDAGWGLYADLLRPAFAVPLAAKPPTPAPERVGAVAKRVRDKYEGCEPDCGSADLDRLLACAEASDAAYEFGQNFVGGRHVVYVESPVFAAWRRTVTGEAT